MRQDARDALAERRVDDHIHGDEGSRYLRRRNETGEVDDTREPARLDLDLQCLPEYPAANQKKVHVRTLAVNDRGGLQEEIVALELEQSGNLAHDRSIGREAEALASGRPVDRRFGSEEGFEVHPAEHDCMA